MTEHPKRKSRNSGKWALLFMLVMALVLTLWSRHMWERGRNKLLADLGMDGYRVMVDPALERGDGRYTVQAWRDGAWAEVAR